MSNFPLVSLIVPTMNKETTIGKLLETMRAQTYQNIEIVIVDEYSKDKTVAIARSYDARVFFGGPERSIKRNIGIDKSRGKYVFIIDSDQELGKNLVEDCVKRVKNCDFLAIPELPFGPDFRAKCHRFEKLAYLEGFSPVEGARFFPKKLVQSVGGYDPEMVGAEDWDLTQRLLEKGYKMGHSKEIIHHNDGQYDFIGTIRKKYFYGQVYRKYAKRHPKAFAMSIARFSILKNLKLFFQHPILFIGSIIFRFIEGTAVLAGAVFSKDI